MDEKDTNRINKVTEELTEAARESYNAAVDRAFAAQESSMKLTQSFFEDWADTLQDQAELNRHTLQSLADLAREQREVFQELTRESLHAYDGFLDSLFSYYKETVEQPEESGTDRR